jgi:hypothetical protein
MLHTKRRCESNLTPHPASLREAGLLMRRTIVLLATMALTLLVASGVRLAVFWDARDKRSVDAALLIGTSALLAQLLLEEGHRKSSREFIGNSLPTVSVGRSHNVRGSK